MCRETERIVSLAGFFLFCAHVNTFIMFDYQCIVDVIEVIIVLIHSYIQYVFLIFFVCLINWGG